MDRLPRLAAEVTLAGALVAIGLGLLGWIEPVSGSIFLAAGIVLAIWWWVIKRTWERSPEPAPTPPPLFEDGLVGKWEPVRSTSDPLLPYGFRLYIFSPSTKERLGLGLKVTCTAPVEEVRIETEVTDEGPLARRSQGQLNFSGESPEFRLFWIDNYPSTRHIWLQATLLSSEPIRPVRVERIPFGELRHLKQRDDALRAPPWEPSF